MGMSDAKWVMPMNFFSTHNSTSRFVPREMRVKNKAGFSVSVCRSIVLGGG